MNHSPRSLQNAFDQLKSGRAKYGFTVEKIRPAGNFSVEKFELDTGYCLQGEYLAFCDILRNDGICLDPFFRGDPIVLIENACKIFWDGSAYRRSDDFPYLSFAERDGSGLFIPLIEEKKYEAQLLYIAHGIEPQVEFPSIEALLLGVSECLSTNLMKQICENAFGQERQAQDRILRKYQRM